MSMNSHLPIAALTDSYKAGHPFQYPPAKKMVAYGEFRKPYKGQTKDTRMVFYGIRYIVENYLHRQWTLDDIEKAEKFYNTHNAEFKKFPFPKDLFVDIVKENNGYFPIKLQALQEGTSVNVRVPVYQITAEGKYARLVTFMETILSQVWYPSSVATLSRRTRDIIEAAFEASVEEKFNFLLDSRLHDFGFRGCTCVEQSVLGGCAHLLNFTGSDTMSAAYYAQFNLNGGDPVATSIPATEHSVMTAWRSETEAITNMIERYGDGIYACVMDSYDYERALYKVIPNLKQKIQEKGGFLVLRPDSGDPTEAVLMGLDAAEKAFGSTVNSKGKKVINNCGVIQGDGINIDNVKEILDVAIEKGYSAQNMAFGMGAGLLQKVDRDTMSFATKLCFIEYEDGKTRDVMKLPKTDGGKNSLPGILQVKRNSDGVPTVYPAEADIPGDDLLKVVYDNGPVEGAFDSNFTALRTRVKETWSKLPVTHTPFSDELNTKMAAWIKAQRAWLEELKKTDV